MRRTLHTLFLACCLLMPSLDAHAVNPDEVLDDPQLEQRARSLSTEIRCLVCQNQSIDDSDAQLARDLRLLVREKLVEGLSDEEIFDYLVARYGEFVLLKPRLNAGTIVLWVAPFVLLLIGGVFVWRLARKKMPEVEVRQATALTAEEKANLSKLLKD